MISTNDLNHISLDYSLKNIPIACRLIYKQKLHQKLYKFIQNQRWKAYWYLRHNNSIIDNDILDNTYFGFPTKTLHLNAKTLNISSMICIN